MLAEKGLPQMRHILAGGRNGWTFMHDGDGAHTAKKTKKFLDDAGVKVLEPWPAHSPDLNQSKMPGPSSSNIYSNIPQPPEMDSGKP